jgi:hypothetical protein
MDLLENLEPLLRIFWLIALPASLFFIIQSIMTFVGADSGDGVDTDIHDGSTHDLHTDFEWFTLRNLVNFMLGFGWSGVGLYDVVSSKSALVAVAFIIGCGFVYMFFVIIKQIQKLAEDNTFSIQNTLHKTAQVYLPIPADKGGTGKIQVSVNGAVYELDAVTENEALATGQMVRVTGIIDTSLLLVEKF